MAALEESLEKFQEKINYFFKDKEILKKSLIHRSYGNEHWEYKKVNNERLELLS